MSRKGKRNLSVVARNHADGFYYSGLITTGISEEEKNVLVKFRSNKLQDVHLPVKHVIVVGGAVPCPELQIWDYVLVRCPGRSKYDKECYMPGRVRFLCEDNRRNNKLYTIELYTLEQLDETRRYIVKIGKKKYRKIVEYIYGIRGVIVPEQVLHKPHREVDKSDKSTVTDPVVPPQITQKIVCRHYHWHRCHRRRRSSERPVEPTLAEKQTQTDNTQEPEENVLARCQDDGWYCFCKIVATDENGYVRVLFSTGDEERIKLEDIIHNTNNDRIQVGDKVVALHPKYVYSYAPATVLEVYNDDYLVKFYDNQRASLLGSQVRKISERKYRKDVDYIKSLRVSGRVVARDDADGIYRPYISEGIDHQTQEVRLRTSNNEQVKQSAIHVLSIDMPCQETNRNWQYVIGPLDQACTDYLPAQIVGRRPLQLFFCNGMQSSHTNLSQCIYINEDYYRNATIFFSSKIRRSPADGE